MRFALESNAAGRSALFVSLCEIFGGNPPVTVIDTGSPTGRSLLLVKDSFANAIVPFLLSSFERITLVDARHGSAAVRDALEQSRPSDVLVLYSLSQLLTDETLHQLNPR